MANMTVKLRLSVANTTVKKTECGQYDRERRLNIANMTVKLRLKVENATVKKTEYSTYNCKED